MKKGQGLPLNVVIIAILALIVLIVLVVIFTGKIGGFGRDIVSCSTRGGKCASGECPPGAVYATIKNTDCDQQGSICCVEIYKTTK